MRRLLVTGGMGFIGSNFILYMLRKYDDIHITNFDLLTYAGNPDHVAEAAGSPRYRFVRGDIANHAAVERYMRGSFDAIVHFAAESHVDRSIRDPGRFVRTNVVGTQRLLEMARKRGVGKFVHISTDEVYGSLGAEGSFSESTPLAPNSPYAASKAGSDMLVRAYCQTYGFPAVITRCSNNYGPRQHHEKLIPTVIANALNDSPIPIYGSGLQVRDWLHVHDHCAAIDQVLHEGKVGEVYNIGGGNEHTNIEIATMLLHMLGKPASLLEHVTDRLGHDLRYAMDAGKITAELGWKPKYTLAEGLRETVDWYKDRFQKRNNAAEGALWRNR